MALTDEQIERYSRHIILKEVGAKGQKKLLNAKVLIIGAGGLGAPAAMYLGAAGVGTIAADHPRHSRHRKSKSKIRKRDDQCDEPGCNGKNLPPVCDKRKHHGSDCRL